jgi:acyl-CoA synthetase (AMP-forming)/AMP-acid ligase II
MTRRPTPARRAALHAALRTARGAGALDYAGSVHVTSQGEHRNDTSAGLRVDGAQAGIRDVEGRGLMAGYFRDADATAAVMKPGGWYASGDLGYLDESGALFVVGLRGDHSYDGRVVTNPSGDPLSRAIRRAGHGWSHSTRPLKDSFAP